MSAEWNQPCWNVIAEPGGPFTCALTCCFPCVTYGMNISKLGDAKAEVMFSGQFSSACCLYCCIASLGCPCVVHIPTRQHIRKKYGVKEPQHGLLEDVLMTWCCSCCAIIQDYNEIAAAEGANKGAIFSDLQTATETAMADVKKQAQAAKESVAAAVEKATEKSEEKDEKEKKEEEEEEKQKEKKSS